MRRSPFDYAPCGAPLRMTGGSPGRMALVGAMAVISFLRGGNAGELRA
jgi:hypothetical protein